MPHATTNDGVRLYFEETGRGMPLIFVHEFAGDHRAWEPQMRHFGQRYRAITFAARSISGSGTPAVRGRWSSPAAAMARKRISATNSAPRSTRSRRSSMKKAFRPQ